MVKHTRICQVCGWRRELKTAPLRAISKFQCPECGSLHSLKYIYWSNGNRNDHVLTDNQLEALRWAANGKSVKEMVRLMDKNTVGAVQDAVNLARKKLGASNVTHAVHLAHQRGIL